MIWALNKEQSSDAAAMGAGVRHLQDLARQLRWQLPLHLWQVCDSGWEQHKRETQAVGCLLPSRRHAAGRGEPLWSICSSPCATAAGRRCTTQMQHDFLLRLSRDLQVEGIARWRQALAPLFGEFARGVPLRGLWFSLPLPAAVETPR